MKKKNDKKREKTRWKTEITWKVMTLVGAGDSKLITEAPKGNDYGTTYRIFLRDGYESPEHARSAIQEAIDRGEIADNDFVILPCVRLFFE